MGLIAFGNDVPLWGGNNTLCRAIINFAIKELGERDYLVDFRNKFDWGYNSIDLEDITRSQILEFLGVVRLYVVTGEYANVCVEPSLLERFHQFHLELIDKMSEYYRIRTPQ
jgi:hypothetical protein